MYRALYRTKRPEVFGEILGQEHIVKILRHQIKSDTVSHAYLFNGTRGTGKTSTARILAKAVNCTSGGDRPCGVCDNCVTIAEGRFMDVIEIDAASNNGVDNIRELRESVKYPPQIGKKKVYIIDEVHMLSSGAFNALLKTLEEPPENVMFILCTTEPNKLPQTILSRCMRLDFKRVPQDILAESMREICRERGVEISDNAVRLIASNADGSVRDGLSILDQVLASGESRIEREDVLEYLGTVGDEFFIELTDYVSSGKTGEALVLLDRALLEGKDCKQLMKDWNGHYRNLMIAKFMRSPENLLNMSSENLEKLRAQSERVSFDEIDKAIQRISKTINEARWSSQPRILMELDIVAISGLPSASTNNTPEVAKPRLSPASVEEIPAADATKATYAKERAIPAHVEQEGEHEPPEADSMVETETSSSLQSSPPPVIAESEKPAPQSSSPSQATSERRTNVYASDGEKEKFWQEILNIGEKTNGSFNLIRKWARIDSMSDMDFVITVTTSFAKKHIEEKTAIIEDIAKELTGKSLRMQVVIDEPKAAVKKESGEELVRRASEALGINIIVED